jgi:hypothetical protein
MAMAGAERLPYINYPARPLLTSLHVSILETPEIEQFSDLSYNFLSLA